MTLEKEIIAKSQDVEVREKKPRRRFTADEKRRIVAAAEECTKPGELTALLRREGLYWSYICNWRRAFKKDGLTTKRGPKPRTAVEVTAQEQVRLLERKLAKATARAERAEALVDLQKKVAALLTSSLDCED